MAATAKADALRFLTFTVRHRELPLGQQLDELYAWFRELRRSAEWKKHVRGGVAFLEIKRNRETGLYHPHLHVLADGVFWAQASISRLWNSITGGSPIVDIRAVHSRKDAAEYVAKYAGKPPNLKYWPRYAIQDLAAAMHRRRALITFGTLHNVPVDRDDDPEASKVAQERVPLAQVEGRSRSGCRLAQVVLRALAQQSNPYARTVDRRPPSMAPVLAEKSAQVMAAAPAALAELVELWQSGPQWFQYLDGPPEPPPAEPDPPGRRIDPADTPPMGDWLDPPDRWHR